MPNLSYKQCVRCIMDTSDPEITFDERGYCNHCRDFDNRLSAIVYQGEVSDLLLQQQVERMKRAGKNSDYDCLIGISGGIDSCYVAYLTHKLGLRALAVHMDNGWNSEEAVKNIKKVCSKLGVDYQSYVLDWDQFKDVQLAFLRASIVEMEIPTDVAIPAALHKIAAENRIKFILSGGNQATEGLLPKSWFYNPKDSKLLYAIWKKFGSKKSRKAFPTFDYPTEIYYKFVKGIRILYPLNHVDYSKEEAKRLLKEEFGWIDYGGKHHESHFTKIVQAYIQPVKFNVDYRRATLSNQICMGTVTREEALAELERKPYPFDPDSIEQDKEYVAKKLGITLEEFEEIMSLPPRTYRDYPNNEKFLEFLYASYRKIFS